MYILFCCLYCSIAGIVTGGNLLQAQGAHPGATAGRGAALSE